MSKLPENILHYPAPAKLNLGLHIVGRRADGYHELESIFTFVDWQDTLAILPRDDGRIVLHTPTTGVLPENDLTVRAAYLLRDKMGLLNKGADIWVDKAIPMGAGLGGGSSDAATVLMVLNQLWQCGLSTEELINLGVKLGADVPFFLFGKSAFVQGIGEKLQQIEVPEQWYVVVKPDVHIATAKVFSHADLVRDSLPVSEKSYTAFLPLYNDMQAVVLREYPEVREVFDELQQYGQPLMTGSGACLFLICSSQEQAESIQKKLPERFLSRCVKGMNTHSLVIND